MITLISIFGVGGVQRGCGGPFEFECNFVRTTSKEKMGGEYRVCEIEVVLECL